MHRHYYIYIMTNANNTVLYTGVTNNLVRRVGEHVQGRGGAFTSRYRVHKLVYYEIAEDVHAAIAREKQIKAGSRARKVALVEGMNPAWADLVDTL
jgi:putative endonuclease